MKAPRRLSVILLLSLLCVFALLPGVSLADGAGYEITSYDVKIDIGADNVYHVSETLAVSFREPSREIYRSIPYIQTMLWQQNGEERATAHNTKLRNISVEGGEFTKKMNGGNLILRIGSKDTLITGDKIYKINYDHELGDDRIKEQDFVYYDLVGTEWDCDLKNVSFSVTLPKDFDAASLRFFSGGNGSTEKASLLYSVDGRTVSGTLGAALAPREGLTLQLDLPSGYFEFPKSPWPTVFTVSAAVLALLMLVLFLIFGRDRVLVKTVEFYPPDGINPVETGCIIDTEASSNDIAALIIYWASKGYISIEPAEDDDFRLIKLKEPGEGARDYEKRLFDRFFAGSETTELSKPHKGFRKALINAMASVEVEYEAGGKRLYSAASAVIGKVVAVASSLLIAAALFYTSYVVDMGGIVFSLVLSLGLPALMFFPLRSLKRLFGRWYVTKTLERVLGLIGDAVLCAANIIVCLVYMGSCGMLALGAAVVAANIFCAAASLFMRKRTAYGNEIFGRLLGFRSFLERAEKDEIDRLVEENSSYFYDVLPYAYVLGVSDLWISKFSDDAISSPAWYQGGSFSPASFLCGVSGAVHTASSKGVSGSGRSFGGSSGNFSGGGSSGGGFGGRW